MTPAEVIDPRGPGADAPWPYARAVAWTIGLLALAAVLSYLDRQLIAILAPAIKTSLAISDVQLSLLQGMAFAVFFALAGIPIGKLVDARNRRNIIVLGLALWSAMTMACGLATTFESFFGARMLVGAGEACLIPAAVSIIADIVRPEGRGRAMGIVLSGGSIGGGLSTFVGGIGLAAFAGISPTSVGGLEPWQLTFIAVGAPGLLLALVLWLTFPEPRRRDSAAPAVDARVLRNIIEYRRILFPAYAAFGLVLLVSYGLGGWLPSMFLREFEVSTLTLGTVLGTLQVAIGVIAPVLGGWAADTARRVDPQHGRTRLAQYLLIVLVVLGAGLLLSAGWFTASLAIYGLILFTLSSIAVTGIVILQEAVPDRMRGQVVAVYTMITSVAGQGFGPLIVAVLTDHIFANEAMLRQSIGCVVVAGSIASFLILTALRRRETPLRPAAVRATP